MNEVWSRVGWRLWLQWVLASATGAAATLGVALLVENLRRGPFLAYAAVSWTVGVPILARMPVAPSIPVYRAVSWVLAGVSVGIMQWLVLRRPIFRSSWWVLASAAGWTAGGALATLVDVPDAQPIMVALSLGIMQWLVLRRRLPRAGWWVLASTFSWLFGGVAAEGVIRAVGAPGLILGLALLGTVAGAVTGVTLLLLLGRPVQASDEATAR